MLIVKNCLEIEIFYFTLWVFVLDWFLEVGHLKFKLKIKERLGLYAILFYGFFFSFAFLNFAVRVWIENE